MSATAESVPPSSPATERVLKVRGGHRLAGEVKIGGAKNAALKAMAACLLTDDEVRLDNMPMISDVAAMADLLRVFGAEVEIDGNQESVTVRAARIVRTDAPAEHFSATRASVVVAGPMLARAGEISFAGPGGDQIGSRPIDIHLDGFRRLGAEVTENGRLVVARAATLSGTMAYLDYPTHTGTENIMMAATLAQGTTVIANACAEPEVIWLGELLNRMGARISGLGTPTITIEGVGKLHGTSMMCIPDRLEAGTFAIASVITGGEVRMEGVTEPHLLPVSEKLRQMGAEIWFAPNRMLLKPAKELKPVKIQTLPFPGFPTDQQATMLPLLTQANGTSVLQERVYENRLLYVSELEKMGAVVERPRVDAKGNPLFPTAIVHGPVTLHGAAVSALDIRAGVSLVLAGLVAEGETVISNVDHIDRGYANFVKKLTDLGADLEDTHPAQVG
ncbi:MAG TPA: UDP-N-acetylglucosamine 1-carboxyvinyltransferase [Thermomicrobiales bacterium]|nr:UDP-N-acetylglucosamine 1-carboxyvinyltransferase [Thermomicrobiales bacterium]